MDDPVYSFDASQMPMMANSSSFDESNWCLQAPAMLSPLVKQLPDFRNENLSGHKRMASLPQPTLHHDWLGNGVAFDSSDFMSDLHQLSPRIGRTLAFANQTNLVAIHKDQTKSCGDTAHRLSSDKPGILK